jgi:hypothetical protein
LDATEESPKIRILYSWAPLAPQQPASRTSRCAKTLHLDSKLCQRLTVSFASVSQCHCLSRSSAHRLHSGPAAAVCLPERCAIGPRPQPARRTGPNVNAVRAPGPSTGSEYRARVPGPSTGPAHGPPERSPSLPGLAAVRSTFALLPIASSVGQRRFGVTVHSFAHCILLRRAAGIASSSVGQRAVPVGDDAGGAPSMCSSSLSAPRPLARPSRPGLGRLVEPGRLGPAGRARGGEETEHAAPATRLERVI